jgi:short-subunit dehydrogenase
VETEGFPQAATLPSALLRSLVVGPDHVARQVVRAIARDRQEMFVPHWYRVVALAQALAPGLVARLSSRFAYRPGPTKGA